MYFCCLASEKCHFDQKFLSDTIVVGVKDGMKFVCIDFSSQEQKSRKALCIQTDLFLSFLITQLSFPINVLNMYCI